MTKYIAFLRGINVGGVILPMSELKILCENSGFKNVRTYIQSGNVLFESSEPPDVVSGALEKALEGKLKRKIPVILRTAAELLSVCSANPFDDANPSRVGVLFLKSGVSGDLMDGVEIAGREEVVVSGKELYIHYPDGMGRSKLKLPKVVSDGTMRNMNTVTKLVNILKG
jgi:uncharacterized protein (DUF1697 family)